LDRTDRTRFGGLRYSAELWPVRNSGNCGSKIASCPTSRPYFLRCTLQLVVPGCAFTRALAWNFSLSPLLKIFGRLSNAQPNDRAPGNLTRRLCAPTAFSLRILYLLDTSWPISLSSAIENRSLSSQQGPYQALEKEMAPMAQYIPRKAAKRYGLCHAVRSMILIPEEASSDAHGADGDTFWVAVRPGACVAHHGHIPAKQVRFSLH
jgi:hypothetical protein